jgi:GAF domain-containing protein
MTNQALPSNLQTVLETNDEAEAVFSALLPALGEALQCDRCFLYLRNPNNKMGKVTHCWRRNSQIPEVIDPDWKKEPESLPDEDPLFAAALHAKPTIFVEDVETASPNVVNRAFEQANFGHRALIHAHLRQNGLLWGILQPCIFGHPRTWTDFDRSLIAQVEEKITPLAIAYVKAANV